MLRLNLARIARIDRDFEARPAPFLRGFVRCERFGFDRRWRPKRRRLPSGRKTDATARANAAIGKVCAVPSRDRTYRRPSPPPERPQPGLVLFYPRQVAGLSPYPYRLPRNSQPRKQKDPRAVTFGDLMFERSPPRALFRTPYRKRIGIGSPAGMAPGLTTSAGLSHSIVSVDDAGRRPVKRLELIMQPLRRL